MRNSSCIGFFRAKSNLPAIVVLGESKTLWKQRRKPSQPECTNSSGRPVQHLVQGTSGCFMSFFWGYIVLDKPNSRLAGDKQQCGAVKGKCVLCPSVRHVVSATINDLYGRRRSLRRIRNPCDLIEYTSRSRGRVVDVCTRLSQLVILEQDADTLAIVDASNSLWLYLVSFK